MDAATSTADWMVYQHVCNNGSFRSLRAMRKIRQGETIYTIKQPEFLPEPDMYSLEISPGVHLDCEYIAIGAMNHSCKANAALKGNRIVAWACIEPGEEITIDYRRTETHLAAPFTCNCCGQKMEW